MQAKIWNINQWIKETNPSILKEIYEGILRKSGFNILGKVEHYFHPQGYTLLFLLAESHFAIHTFPEYEKTYIELSSCNEEYYKKFLELTRETE